MADEMIRLAMQKDLEAVSEEFVQLKSDLKSDLNEETAERKAEIAVERERINQFKALAEGSTTGDAELMDIRVGADGKTYDSAGAAVREQVSQLSSEIDEVESDIYSYSQEKISLWVLGGINNNGYDTTYGNRARNEYIIKVSKGDKIECEIGYKYRVALYRSTSLTNLDFIGYMSDTFLEETDTIFTEDCYMRMTVGYVDNAELTESDLTNFDKNIRVYRKQIRGETNKLKGLNVAIIGDSISTNGTSGTNANVAEITITTDDIGVELSAYLTYYDVQNGLSLGGHTFLSSEIGSEVTFTPISDDVGKSIGLSNNYNDSSTKVWWEVAKDELGFNPIPVCWSGSSITSHETNLEDRRKCSHSWHESQIRKCGIRKSGSMERTAPDVIIIYRGTNDFSHEPYTTLTENYFESLDFEYPETDLLSNESYGYKEGYTLLISKLRTAYPKAKIFLCTLNVFKRVNYSHFPTNNSLNTLPQYNNAIREIADFMGCGLIEFDKDGITFENCYSGGYITDSETMPTHPNDKGHKVMGLKAITDLSTQFSKMI